MNGYTPFSPLSLQYSKSVLFFINLIYRIYSMKSGSIVKYARIFQLIERQPDRDGSNEAFVKTENMTYSVVQNEK